MKKMIKAADLAKVRDVDFTERFTVGIQTLMKMLGITSKLEKKAGEVLKVYKVARTLEDGTVAEGEVIPLSKYKTTYEPIGEAKLKKWRKQTTAEAISDKGYGQAVNDTNAKMLKDIQKGIRTKFVNYLATGTGTATGVGLQAAMAQVWGQLQVLWEDTSVEVVYFMNPLDVADYLGKAQVSTQTAFGMSYIENFLGMGTAILAADIPKGKIYATAADNVVLYYIPVTSSDMAQAFNLTADATGLIGIHTDSIYNNVTVETVALSGVGLFAENLAGIVVGSITDAVQPDTTLASLSIGSKTLSSAFNKNVIAYTVDTTDATNTITAAASASGATVEIKNGSTAVTSGNAATWVSGANTVTIKVTNGSASQTYTVTVTKA
ncbi:MAG: cadherin-like beta sandwich domain-containing protein [Eubacterium aggregans]